MPPEQHAAERSLMEDLADAFDSQENVDEVREPTPTEVLRSEEDENGHETEDRPAEPEETHAADADPDRERDPRGEQREPAEEEGEGAPDRLAEPPRGLTAAQREAWKNTPKEIREAMHKRSEDYSNGIQKYASQAKKGDLMDQVFQPYRQLFAMNSVEPPQLVNQLLQTASVLQMGTPAQKAGLVANMVKQFGVDIHALDSALAGEAPKEGPESKFEQMLQQRLAPLQQKLQQYEQRDLSQQQQEQAQINSEIQQFAADPKNEFFADVREDMADWLELASKRGQTMTLREAYDRACRNHPEIAKIIEARQASGTVERKRRASVSVSGSPGGSPGVGAPKDLRGALEAAIDGAGRL